MSRKRQRDSTVETTAVEPQTPKRRRQISEQDRRLAKLYEDLADEASDIRLKAAKELLVQLSPENGPSPGLVLKTLNRLIRGLCSGRKAARYGFFVAFTELLRQVYGGNGGHEAKEALELKALVQLIIKVTQPDGKAVGQVRIFLMS
jgi:DNA polymerase phi